MRIRFGEYLFDDAQRELLRGSEVIHLSPRAFELMAFLLRRRPQAVTKEELYRHLWPDTFVEYANLNNLISEIRAAIGDSARTKLRTKHRYGYAFTADSSASTDAWSSWPHHLARFHAHRRAHAS